MLKKIFSGSYLSNCSKNLKTRCFSGPKVHDTPLLCVNVVPDTILSPIYSILVLKIVLKVKNRFITINAKTEITTTEIGSLLYFAALFLTSFISMTLIIK